MTGIVHFNIILKSGFSGTDPHISMIEDLKPDPAVFEHCRRYLVKRNIVCHLTSFGFACSASSTIIEEVFNTLQNPTLPEEIEKHIEQITIEAPPTFF